MTIEERVAKNEAVLQAQHEWNKRQNGSLQRIEHKVDKATYLLIATALGIIADIVVKAVW